MVGCRSEKTIRLWVKSGKLCPLPGSGGQGRPLLFAQVDVQALRVSRGRHPKTSHTFKPYAARHPRETASMADIESLSLVIAGYTNGELPSDLLDLALFKPRTLDLAAVGQLTGRNDLAPDEQATLEAWYRNTDLSPKKQNGITQRNGKASPIPPTVPEPVLTLAKKCGRVLSRLEMQFIGATFAVALSPWLGVNQTRQKELVGGYAGFVRGIHDESGGSAEAGVYMKVIDVLSDFHESSKYGIRSLDKRALSAIAVAITASSHSSLTLFSQDRLRKHLKVARKCIKTAEALLKKRRSWPSISSVCIGLEDLTKIHLHRQQGKRLLRGVGRRLGKDDFRRLYAFVNSPVSI